MFSNLSSFSGKNFKIKITLDDPSPPPQKNSLKRGIFWDFFSMFFLFFCTQHCFICRPSDSTVSEDAGIKPRTVAILALDVPRRAYSMQIELCLWRINLQRTERPWKRSQIINNDICILFYYFFIHCSWDTPCWGRSSRMNGQAAPLRGLGQGSTTGTFTKYQTVAVLHPTVIS